MKQDNRVVVSSAAVDWLKKHYPQLCIKAGLCESVGGRLYTKTFSTAPEAPAQADEGDVVVTWNHDRTRILAVTRQNAEGQILKVIAEAPTQAEAPSEAEIYRAWDEAGSPCPLPVFSSIYKTVWALATRAALATQQAVQAKVPHDVLHYAKTLKKEGYSGPLHWARTVIDWVAAFDVRSSEGGDALARGEKA